MTPLRQRPVLGVLGGMGPLATVDFLDKLTRHHPVTRDQDHLAWVCASQPGAPDRSRAVLDGSDAPFDYLRQGAGWLAGQGVALIAMPCNTSHFWHARVQAICPVPILHIAQAAADELLALPTCPRPVAVLATRGTVHAGIYEPALADCAMPAAALTEGEQTAVDTVIGQVKAGKLAGARQAMADLLHRLDARGIGTLVLGCTELPLGLPVEPGAIPATLRLVDTSTALAKACVRRLTDTTP